MARKTSTESAQPIYSRKHISRAEREAKQRQRVVIGTSIVAALVVLILLAGLVYSIAVEPGQAMATVDGEQITRRQLYQRINLERFRFYQQMQEMRQQLDQMVQESPDSAAFLGQYYQQQLAQQREAYANPQQQESLASSVLNRMIEEKLIEREAAARGIEVSEAEIDEEIRRTIARLEEAQIEVDVTATAEAAVAATATAAQFTPTPSPTVEAGAILTESESITATESLTPTVTPMPTLTPMPTPTPNILSDDLFSKRYATFLEDLKRYTGYTEADFRNVIRLQLLREKLQEAVGAEVEVARTEEQVHAAHILVESEEEAQAVVERLEAGEEFADVAAEVSTDTSNSFSGGDLGWFGRDQMVEPFSEAAFALEEPGEISEPVESEFGWHVIKLIEGPEERERSEQAIQQERDQAFTEWLNNAKNEASIDYAWTLDDLPRDPLRDRLELLVPTPAPTQAPLQLTPGAGEVPEEEPAEGSEELPAEESETGSEESPAEESEEAPAEEAPTEEATDE